MSTTTAQQPRTVTVQLDDPFSSVFQPSYQEPQAKPRKSAAFASSEINSNHKAETFLPPTVQPSFSDPLLKPVSTISEQYVPKAEYTKARRSARDAWFAVVVLSGFITLGTYYLIERVGNDGAKIQDLGNQVTSLSGQLETERGVVVARNKEIQVLNDQLTDERARTSKLLNKR